MRKRTALFIAAIAAVAVVMVIMFGSIHDDKPSQTQSGSIYLDHASVDLREGGGYQLNVQWRPTPHFSPQTGDQCVVRSGAIEGGVALGRRDGPLCAASAKLTVKKGPFTARIGYASDINSFPSGATTIEVKCPDVPGPCERQ